MEKISTAFDIGYSSIGWSVLQNNDNLSLPQIIGCGVFTFPKEDNQNQRRSGFKRQRRHIAATRNRINRLLNYLTDIGALMSKEAEEMKQPAGGHPSPWILAASALTGQQLTWKKLAHVIIWYAHNRGYDANAMWAKDSTSDDAKMEQSALELMDHCNTKTMYETWVQLAGLDISGSKRSTQYHMKGEKAAFPRKIVEDEVRRILSSHIGFLPGLTSDFVSILLEKITPQLRKKYKLPDRFTGGLLFGQMLPRFDNRIIPLCPISGNKVPLKFCPEFFKFRFAMLLANFRVIRDGKSEVLRPEERQQLYAIIEKRGFSTINEIKSLTKKITSSDVTPLDDLFFTDEAANALILDPVKKAFQSREKLKGIWDRLDLETSNWINKILWRKKRFSLKGLLELLDEDSEVEELREVIQNNFEKSRKKRKKYQNFSHYLEEFIDLVSWAKGRAPYSRPLMVEAFEQVFLGLHPLALADRQPIKAEKQMDGCLVRTKEIVEKELNRNIDNLSNNHLVRHRLKMFELLYEDIIKKYAGGDANRIEYTTIEVADDIQEYSGKTAKEKAAHFSAKISPFTAAKDEIEHRNKNDGFVLEPTYSNIRKVRIAVAQGWQCPYTGKYFGLQEIHDKKVDREHIIPHSKRPSNSLDSLILAFSEINREKSNLTAWEFIERYEGETLSGYTIRGLNDYENWVKNVNSHAKI